MTVADYQKLAPENHLLAALPNADWKRVKSKLEFVFLNPGEILYEADKSTEYAYFPTTAVVSLLHVMENGSTAAVSTIGNDGMIGMALFMRAETVPNEAIVVCAGASLRIKQRDLLREFKRGGVFQTLLLRFTIALFDQTSQIAACNRLHSVEKQFCRWLLLTHDRLNSDDIEITHDRISQILGISREGITLAVKKLKEKRLINNNRGFLTVRDRHGLELNVCECYSRITKEYNRLLGRGISRTFG